jgi:VanZ family protein
MRAFARYWLPPLLWMALIWGLSGDIGSAEQTSRFFLPIVRALLPWASPEQLRWAHGLVRKLGHVTEYAILAGLWFRAFHAGGRGRPATSARAALALSVGWAVVDELHQAMVGSRTGTWRDVLLDGAGAVLALTAVRLRLSGRPEPSRPATSAENAVG